MHPKYIKENLDDCYIIHFDVAGLVFDDSLIIIIDDDNENNNRILTI